ncbi:TetR/AcrR family transcriptional regulator [Aldersonia sp. NBC_00410]|uniref:TetR/AcrR family transcriptional regulator n=1 Tax=Aldersonia sp. NBC_00410 TaxID=2975954 RepID=UPI00224F12C5|nr:TetR/AcrR family transcriptional regulator [Aldersonia sp. NBC_00410]
MSSAEDAARQRYAGVPFADRKNARRERLLDAALHLLDSEGFAAVTVRRVCQEAGLNNRYFYENFTDIETLFDALVDRLEQDLGHNVAELVANQPHATVDQAIDILVSAFVDDPRLLQILHSPAEPTIARRRNALLLSSVAIARPYLERAAAEFGTPDQHMLDTACFLLIGGWSDTLWAFADGQLAIERAALVNHLARLFTGIARTLATHTLES